MAQKLHLGCGNIILDGYLNVDILPGLGVDLVSDVRKLPKLKDNSADEIYLSHVLEHFSRKEIPEILKEYFRILKDGGVLRLAVPDMDKFVKHYWQNWDWFREPRHEVWNGFVYGGQKDEYDFHKTGFNFPFLRFLLEEAGFSDVKEYLPSEVRGRQDGSFSDKPFGSVSLNVVAVKGQPVVLDEKVFDYSFGEKVLIILEKIFSRIASLCVSLRLRLIRRRLYGSWNFREDLKKIFKKK